MCTLNCPIKLLEMISDNKKYSMWNSVPMYPISWYVKLVVSPLPIHPLRVSIVPRGYSRHDIFSVFVWGNAREGFPKGYCWGEEWRKIYKYRQPSQWMFVFGSILEWLLIQGAAWPTLPNIPIATRRKFIIIVASVFGIYKCEEDGCKMKGSAHQILVSHNECVPNLWR